MPHDNDDISLDYGTAPPASHEDALLGDKRPSTCWTGCAKLVCGNRLAVGTVVTLVTLVVMLGAILVAIFAGGASFAQLSLDKADIHFSMVVTGITDNTVHAHVSALLGNRNSVGATIQASTLSLAYGDQAFANVDFPEIQLDASAIVHLELDTELRVTSAQGFTTFTTHLLQDQLVTVRLFGPVRARSMGLSFSLTMDKDITLEGMANFESRGEPAVRVLHLDATVGSAESLTLTMEVSMPNPSNDVSFIELDRLRFDVFYADTMLGLGVADENVPVQFGDNVFTATAVVTRTEHNAAAIQDLLTQYVNGNTTVLTIRGNDNTTDIALLKDALRSLNARTVLPGIVNLQDQFFTCIYAYLDVIGLITQPDPIACPDTGLNLATNVTVVAHNPLGIDMTFEAANLTASWQGMFFGNADTDALNDTVPAYGRSTIKQTLCLGDNLDVIWALVDHIESIGGANNGIDPFPLFFDITGTASVRMQDFRVTDMVYQQEEVTAVALLLAGAT